MRYLTILALAASLAAAERPMSKVELLASTHASSDATTRAVEQKGVDFRPSADDLAELTAAGAKPDLIAAVKRCYRPQGPPLSPGDLELLLQVKVPPNAVELLIKERGVAFTVTPDIGKRLMAAGADSSLLGSLVLHQK